MMFNMNIVTFQAKKTAAFKKVLDWNDVQQDLPVDKKSRAEAISCHAFSSTCFSL